MATDDGQNQAWKRPPRFSRGLEIAPEPAPEPVRWRLWAGVLVALLVVGAGYYIFSWRYRLPQDRVLTDQDGNSIPARIEARSEGVLRIAHLPDGTTRYLPIDSLSAGDQKFVRRLEGKLKLGYPLRVGLTTTAGKTSEEIVQGRTDKYVIYNHATESLLRYRPLADLSATDQGWLRSLPANLAFRYPIHYTMKLANGEAVDVRVEGRSTALVRYAVLQSGLARMVPIGQLSVADQAFVRELPLNLTYFYPFDSTLVTADGRSLVARVEGRSENDVRYILQHEDLSRIMPLADLSPESQLLLRSLPINIEGLFNPDHLLTSQSGQSWTAHLESRDDALVKFTVLSDKSVHYFPIAMLVEADQAYVRQMPTMLRIDYPLEYLLGALPGPAQRVRLLGRDNTKIKYMNLTDGQTMEVPIADLAATDQVVLRLFPVGIVVAPVVAMPAPEPAPTPAPTPTVPEVAPVPVAPAAPAVPTTKSLVQETLASLKSGGAASAGRSRSGSGSTGNAWETLVRLTVKNDTVRTEYLNFQNQARQQITIKNALSVAIAQLEAIRTRENNSTVENLVRTARRLIEDIDIIANSGNTVNKTALDHISEFVKTWEAAESK